MRNIKGTVALVTGANRGIGRALSEALLSRGARKVYLGTRQLSALDDLVHAHGERVVPLRLDVTVAEDIQRAVLNAGDINLLINNAGVALPTSPEATTAGLLAAGREEMEVNVFGTLALTRALAPVLASHGGGAVVNVVSVAGLVNFPGFLSYSLSKAALHSLTQGLRASLRKQGTLVAGVYPGPVETDMAKNIQLEKTPAADVANAILDGVEEGREEILPDPFAQQIGSLYFKEPKALERQLAAMEG